VVFVTELESADEIRAAAPIGTIWSSSPWAISVGTSNFFRSSVKSVSAAILNLHERIENKLFLDRTRKDSNFKRPHIYATLFQIEKC
jgi:hypothetical protein